MEQTMPTTAPLWTPDEARLRDSAVVRFADFAAARAGRRFPAYRDLHEWSVGHGEEFWDAVWDFCGVIGEKGKRVLADAGAMPGARFFPDSRLNFAENLLRHDGDGDAIVFRAEGQETRRTSWSQLRAMVSRLQQAFAAAGVGKGDRVAAMMPNMPEAIAAMLAASSLGAVFSSCSPDFGENGVIDRFGQIKPKLFLACDGYWYAGKRIDVASKVQAIASRLGADNVVIAHLAGDARALAASIPGAKALDDFVAPFAAGELRFERLAFDHPLYILFSSGTTGVPKCIVHCQGGVLLQHLKEHRIHCDLRQGDRFFYFTTCGWMMWNWLASGLSSGATLVLYDGSPLHPEATALFDLAEQERITFFGASAKFFDAVRKSGAIPASSHDLSSIRTIASTGSPLAPENFAFIHDCVAPQAHLASISGGTDLCACFVGGVPTLPVHVGEIQAPMLGMAVEVWDEEGNPLADAKGELVCVKPFPSMPVGFWNDEDGAKYHDAYFARFPGVWCHGDFAQWTAHGGMVIHGRSDATLNPGGVRIGTAEIYNQVEKLPEVRESLCIGQEWDSDTRIVLFVVLQEGAVLDAALEKTIRDRIRTGASPRHVPARIVAVADIPRTKSGKITEIAVRDIVHGREVKNREALANPEALELYRNLPQLAV
jgi:acetoacetyl-CoA synthetase